ncbi:MAG TPA: acetylornithine transaminase [Polyangiaceae bacterium]|nr:acetylornithine transaminase [Polyangiaceae bacterium]
MASPRSRFDSIMFTTKRPPVVMVRGRGSWLEDEDGKKYLDFIQGWAVNGLGHAPAPIVEAVVAQAACLIQCSPSFYSRPLLDLAALLVDHSAFDRVFFTNCGAEANEGAIKLARKWGQKYRGGAYEIVTMNNSFHGRTLATMSASGRPGWDRLFEPKVPGFPKASLNDLSSVERCIGERTVAVMVEPVQGEGGVNLASQDFIAGLRDLTRRLGLLLIFDEVQTGIGRTGKLFAYEHFGVEPDVMTLGKGIGGGAPLGALLAREEVCCFEPGEQGGTFNGGALVTAVGAAVFRVVSDPAFLARVRAAGDHLQSRLRELSATHGEGEVRGRGLLAALVLAAERAHDIVARAFDAGLLVNAPRANVLRFMPALNVTHDEIDTFIDRLDAVLRA